MSRGLFCLPIACWLLLGPSPAVSGWLDWWQTPEQRAAEALQNGDIDLLRQQAPTDDWRGIGEFEVGEYAEAVRMFDQSAAAHGREGNSEAQADAIYNKGVSQVHKGEYQAAIDSFDSLLANHPSHEDALHNRDIAEQLLRLQQQQQPRDDSGESQGDSSSGDQQQQAGDGQEQSADSGEPSSSTPGESSEQQGEQQSGSSDQQDQSGSGGEPEQQQDQSDAQRALAAEAAGENRGDDSEGESQESMQVSERPMSEADQAAEQMLRRIPDDPAGLLRRKLEQSHRIEFPEIGNAKEPW
ncbi:MAG: hypothetical protein AB8B63_02745 [Granulosicoccus sp.]